MSDHLDEFEIEAEEASGSLEQDLLPEDRESIEGAIQRTREIFRTSRRARLDDAHSALVIWEHVYIYIPDYNLGDRIGEIIDLLEGIGSRRKLSLEDREQGVKVLRAITQVLRGNNRVLDATDETMEGGLESGE